MKYFVNLRIVFNATVSVHADSEEDAEEKASNFEFSLAQPPIVVEDECAMILQ